MVETLDAFGRFIKTSIKIHKLDPTVYTKFLDIIGNNKRVILKLVILDTNKLLDKCLNKISLEN